MPGADDIVLLGSPGTGAQRADELNVGKGHVFSASAGKDPVTVPGCPARTASLARLWTATWTTSAGSVEIRPARSSVPSV
ncbi:hypothetical protein G3I35_10465 [Streptomyces sp. SID10815]|nr:hypothetical protein [Streptomyces sp. SID10815]